MNFGNDGLLKLFIIAIPLFAYFFYKIFRIISNYNSFMDAKTRGKLLFSVSWTSAIIKYSCYFAAFIFFIIALARPYGAPIKSDEEYKGVDIMVLLDTSESMTAIDVKPNRMGVVKQGLKDFLNLLSGDRIGIIVFEKDTFVQCPLTNDYETVDMILDNIYPGMLPVEGTAIGDAIKEGIQRLIEKGEKSRVIILVTDGENLSGMPPIDAARLAQKEGIPVYTVGAGTQQGGPMPEGQDAWGREYYKTYNGQVAITRMDDSELKQVAGITGGKYYSATDPNAFRNIMNDISGMQKNDTKIKSHTKYEENYYIYLFIGIILFITGNILPVRKRT